MFNKAHKACNKTRGQQNNHQLKSSQTALPSTPLKYVRHQTQSNAGRNMDFENLRNFLSFDKVYVGAKISAANATGTID